MNLAETPPPPATLEPRYLIARLSVLIFVAFAIMGAWIPVFSLHLKNLGFTPEETAWAWATNAIGALVAPLIWGQIADRWVAMDRCISLCALASAGGLWLIAELSEPMTLILVCFGMWYFLIPTVGLSTSLIFRQLDHPEREYGKIRMWGTVGWVAASAGLTLWFQAFDWYAGADASDPADLADSLRLGSLAAIVLALYAWTLPHTPPLGTASPRRAWYAGLVDAPLSAFFLFRNRSFAVYCVCMFGYNVTLPFTVQLNSLLLERLGIAAGQLPLCLTIAQSTEVLFLYLLPMLLLRFGTKSIMVLGSVSWTIGLALLGLGSPLWLVLGSLVTHGVFICCFFIAGQVFVNRLATHDIRASAQGLLLLVAGLGLLLGNLLVGWIRDATNDDYGIAYCVAAGLAGGLAMLFLAGFSRSPRETESSQETLVPGAEIT